VPLSKRNIEDWDFRSVPRTGGDKDEFLGNNYTLAVTVEALRFLSLKRLIEMEIGIVSDDREYLTFPDPDHEECFRGYTSSVRLRDLLTREGRLDRWVQSSLWREWKKYGRVKLRLLATKDEVAAYYAEWSE
jgi:hypothetical protein